MSTDLEAELAAAYGFDAPGVTFGAGMRGDEAVPSVQVRVPLAMMNRHGLVAGATGTGKTKTLQVLAEQLSDAGVPVFISDIRATSVARRAGRAQREALASRHRLAFADYAPRAFSGRVLTWTARGRASARASVSSFGPILLQGVDLTTPSSRYGNGVQVRRRQAAPARQPRGPARPPQPHQLDEARPRWRYGGIATARPA